MCNGVVNGGVHGFGWIGINIRLWFFFSCQHWLRQFSYGFSNEQLDPQAKEWILKAAQGDYPILNKMAQENPGLVRRKDMYVSELSIIRFNEKKFQ